jgi:predicted small metal-binding protein
VVKHEGGLCPVLRNHVFDCGQKGAADQMRTAWDKTVHHVRNAHGHDIGNELQNKKKAIMAEPEHAQDVLDKHAERVSQHENQELHPERARPDQKRARKAAVADGADAAVPCR